MYPSLIKLLTFVITLHVALLFPQCPSSPSDLISLNQISLSESFRAVPENCSALKDISALKAHLVEIMPSALLYRVDDAKKSVLVR